MPASALSDALTRLVATSAPPSSKLQQLHALLQQRHADIDRISVALYDADTDLVKTFLHSPAGEDALPQHQLPLAASRALTKIAAQRCPRVIHDMTDGTTPASPHVAALLRHGYRSSYTLPIFRNDRLLGFIFFNSRRPGVMRGDMQRELDMLGHLIGMLIASELHTTNTLRGVVRAMGSITQFRDVETASHLQRMSRFARLVARQLAMQHGLDDEFVEYLFLFAPLHDIGKIAIPDEVLLKPGALSDAEFDVMRTHTSRGLALIDQVLLDMDLHALPHVDLLRNIIGHHHERWDGTGYPHGLAGEAIPLEARIVTVADVFDALVCVRPYKPAWSNTDALNYLRRHAGGAFDPDCVQALLDNMAGVLEIQQQFHCEAGG